MIRAWMRKLSFWLESDASKDRRYQAALAESAANPKEGIVGAIIRKMEGKPSQQPIEQLMDNASSRHRDLHKARTIVNEYEGLMRLSKAMRGPTPEEAAKMEQVREYKRSAFYE